MNIFLIKERIYLGTWLQRVRAHDGGTKSWHQSQEAKHSPPELQAWIRDWVPGMKHDFTQSSLRRDTFPSDFIPLKATQIVPPTE